MGDLKGMRDLFGLTFRLHDLRIAHGILKISYTHAIIMATNG